jgi:DNA invertase Pin-like site-specific DNA recombinase
MIYFLPTAAKSKQKGPLEGTALHPTTPDGRLFFTLTIAVGEWEVNNLAVITVQGLKAAVKRGKKLGRQGKYKG